MRDQYMNLSIKNNSKHNALPGHWYGIGVGPGSKDLLTLRAVNIIKSLDIIIAPKAISSKSSLALTCIQPFVTGKQTIIEHEYTMVRDSQVAQEHWNAVANSTVQYLSMNKSVGHITLGDPLFYSTAYYVLNSITKKIDKKNIHIISGITAFQSCAAHEVIPCATQDDRVCVMTGIEIAAVEKMLFHCEMLILYKCSKKLSELLSVLKKYNLAESCKVFYYIEQENEMVFQSLEEAIAYNKEYMATVIVKIGKKEWNTVCT